MWYHGTTEEQLRSINTHGLRKGTFVSDELAVAEYFAQSRSAWNNQEPIVLQVNGNCEPIRLDRSNRRESRLLAATTQIRVHK